MRSNHNKAVVVPTRCNKGKKMFGVRAELIGDVWQFTWAFPMSEKTSERERFSENKVSGRVGFREGYPGCPHCGNSGLVVCGDCGKVSCIEERQAAFICPWCGSEGEIQFTDSIDGIKGGGY